MRFDYFYLFYASPSVHHRCTVKKRCVDSPGTRLLLFPHLACIACIACVACVAVAIAIALLLQILSSSALIGLTKGVLSKVMKKWGGNYTF